MTNTIKIDLHCHTVSSKDASIKLEDLLAECDRKGIAKIAITDHDRIDGALESASRWPVRIIPGIEIMTSRGELLAYYVRENVPAGISPMDTITLLKSQGAIISVSHPFDPWRNGGWKLACLLEILPWLDAVEGFNAHCFTDKPNRQATSFARTYHLAVTAGSDAHHSFEIGSAGLTLSDFNSPDELRQSLKQAKVFGKRVKLGTRLRSRISRLLR
jgi:hypothetical protein